MACLRRMLTRTQWRASLVLSRRLSPQRYVPRGLAELIPPFKCALDRQAVTCSGFFWWFLIDGMPLLDYSCCQHVRAFWLYTNLWVRRERRSLRQLTAHPFILLWTSCTSVTRMLLRATRSAVSSWLAVDFPCVSNHVTLFFYIFNRKYT